MRSYARALKGTDYGGVKEANRYYRCRNCGFIVDSLKFASGDGSGVLGSIDTIPSSDGTTFKGAYIDSPLMLGSVTCEFSADGSILEKKHITRMDSVGGCPFCGCKNYR